VRGKLLKFALPLLAFLALIAAGCGGGDNESTGGTSPSETTGGGGGGTLVFDALGVLLHESHKPVTRARVDAAKRFLLDESEEFTVVGVSLDDEVRRAGARRPWVAELSGCGLAIRSNLGACCGRSKRRPRT